MAITTDKTINIISGGNFDIGISKSLNNYTFDDLWESAYAGVTATDLKHICDTYTATAIGKDHEGESPLNYLSEDNSYVYISNGTMSYQKPEGYYCKIILLYSDTYHNKSFTNHDTNVFVITSCNMQNIVYTTTGHISNTTPDFPRRPDFEDIKYINDTKTETKSLNGYIIPALLIKYNDTGYVYALLQKNGISYFDYSMSMMEPASVQGYEWGEQMLPFDFDSSKGVAHGLNVDLNTVSPKFGKAYHNVDRFPDAFVSDDKDINAYVQSVSDGHGGIIYRANTITKLNKWMSYFGMMFFSDKFYKPIIKDGVITGYTDDMTIDSEFDSYTGDTQHEVPDKPPLPPDKDDIESVGYGYFSNAVMGSLYSLYNKLDLEKIAQWFYNQTEKIDIANNVISLKEIPFSLSALNIVPIDTDLKIGGVNVTYNNENIKVGEIVSSATTSLSVLFGEFNIPRLSNTFLDYSPYTKYELLLPFAPTPVTLPDWCVNKTVRAIFLYDIYTTACQYVIECNGERICSVSGIFGVDRPISAQNVALKDASRLSAQVATASSVLGGVMSSATGNIGGIVSGAIGGVSALSQMIMSGKQNYMYTVGANGDSSSVGLCHAVHLKITRTLSAEDSNFNHVYGRPLCKYKKLSSITGYTKCDNVNTNGLTCSENEKQRIKQLLETGIYI